MQPDACCAYRGRPRPAAQNLPIRYQIGMIIYMKIAVQVDRCCGHARCAAVAPEIFILNDVGYLDTPVVEVPEGQEQLALKAKRACPEACLSVLEESSQATSPNAHAAK
jgi:ferredoxin